MNRDDMILKKKQRRKLRKIFFRTVGITLAVLAVAAGVLAFVYNKYLYNGQGGSSIKDTDPINKTVAVFGVDEDGVRTDVIFVLNFNSENGRARIISIPRDTKVEWTQSMQDEMESIKGYSRSVSKINEMTSYVGIDKIRDFTIQEIENITGMHIDNYVVVTIDAFKDIVDAIGGVEVDVPVLNGDGLHYDDSAQDLHIHLQPGLQTLDGEAAEGLVRFRKGYAEGDVGRIKTQQLFLEAFAKKITSPQMILKLPSIASTVMQKVTTDVSPTEALGYIPYLKKVNMNELKCDIIPGEAEYQNGKSYFIVDEAAMPEFINEILNTSLSQQDAEDSGEVVIDKTVTIEVLNSTGISGLAGRAAEKLGAEGYTVSQVGNYTADILDTTVIYAKDPALAKQFLNDYSQAEIQQSSDIPYDIQIVLGDDSVEQ